MESTLVNWDALDALIIDFVNSDRLVFSSSPAPVLDVVPAPVPAPEPYEARLAIRQIRQAIERGDVSHALELLRVHAPDVAADHRVLFLLHKQRFIELLRRGTDKDRDAAIECLRGSLAPYALDAYPEAYEEFKHVLLALIYDKDDQSSPVTNEWPEKKRIDLAGLLSSILRAHLRAYDPQFSMTLRYLISIHKLYCSRQGISSPVSDLIERLLFDERDLPATSQETLLEAPPFDEVNIQVLAHAVDLTRQGAVDSLRFAEGDLFLAFQNELCRMRVDFSQLDEIVHEYCIYRGIVDAFSASSDPVTCSSRGCSLDKRYMGVLSDGETSVSNVECEGAQEVSSDAVSLHAIDDEMGSANQMRRSHEDCSTSGKVRTDACYRRLRRSRIHACGERRRKRWRGRIEGVGSQANLPSKEVVKSAIATVPFHGDDDTLTEEKISKNHASESVADIEDKYGIVLELMEMASKGMAAEVVEEVNAMDPDFFGENPLLLFQLKQIEFLKLINSGNHSMALRVASTHLGPLASSDQTLLKSLKETLLAFLKPSDNVVTSGIPLSVLATSLQVAMSRRLGIQEPQLMKIMRATIHTHTEWYKLQMCKDRFEELMKIHHLKEVDGPILCNSASNSSADNCTLGSQITSSSSKTIEEGCSPTQVSSNESVCDENAILKVMEFLALPRADAIHLLNQYHGNAEAVIQQIFT